MGVSTVLSDTGDLLAEKVYQNALSGIRTKFYHLESAEKLAQEHLRKKASPSDAADLLIQNQKKKSAWANTITLVPYVGVPANVYNVLVIQMRMILAIAHMGGYDVRDPYVKTYALFCLFGMGVAKKGQTAAVKGGKSAVEKMGLRAFEKLGTQKGAVLFSKMIPIAGVGLGAALDWVLTEQIGKKAKKKFIIYRFKDFREE